MRQESRVVRLRSRGYRGFWLPGILVTAQIGQAQILSVSCASARNCSAGGYYAYVKDNAYRYYPFVVSEVNGTWHKGSQVPGLAALNVGLDAEVSSVSCASAGNCGASGFYSLRSGGLEAFVVSEVNGTWHTAIEVPGTATLNKGGYAQVNSISCRAAGDCAAGGVYSDSAHHWHAFVVSRS